MSYEIKTLNRISFSVTTNDLLSRYKLFVNYDDNKVEKMSPVNKSYSEIMIFCKNIIILLDIMHKDKQHNIIRIIHYHDRYLCLIHSSAVLLSEN